MKEIKRYKGCFVCGDLNPHGIKAVFWHDGSQAETTIVAGQEFEGYRGIYHGGIMAALLDEVMIKAILALDIFAVTAEMTVRYKQPIMTGDRVVFRGRIVEHKGRVYVTEGEAVGDDGRIFAEATGKYLVARPELREQLVRSLD
ncbi:MAG: PaaI family thioesterase [Candidatus Zixiibacteriota bacterium]